MFLTIFPLLYAQERIAPFALRSFARFLKSNLLTKTEQIDQKTNEQIPNPEKMAYMVAEKLER